MKKAKKWGLKIPFECLSRYFADKIEEGYATFLVYFKGKMDEAYHAGRFCQRLQNLQWFGVESIPEKPDLKLTFEEDAVAETFSKFYALEKEIIEGEEPDELQILKKCMTKVLSLDEQKQSCSDVRASKFSMGSIKKGFRNCKNFKKNIKL